MKSKFYWKWLRFKSLFTRWRLINSHKYLIIPKSDLGKYFFLSDKEYEEYNSLKSKFKNVSIEFSPGGGIGICVYVRTETGEKFNITDYTTW